MADVELRPEKTTSPDSTAPGLRVVVASAALLVVYSYLGALWLNRHGYSPTTLVAIRDWLNKPTGIGEDFGVLGIALLLIVAGFRFAQGIPLRRVLAVAAPVLVVAVTAGAAVLLLGGEPYSAPQHASVTPLGYVSNLFLVDRIAGQPALVALTWPLAVAALNALLAVATTRLAPLGGVVVRLVVLGGLVLFGASGPAPLHQLGLLAGFVPLCVLGDVLLRVRSQRMHALTGAALGAAAFAILILTEHGYDEWHGFWYPVTALYALLIVMLAVPSGKVAGETAIVRWLASRALWLIAAAGVAGWSVLGLVYHRVPLPLSMAAALFVTAAFAEAGYRFVQRPLGGAR
jgi:peptidoglycan/LPS O-acetylase OafA/YrhL